MSTAGSSLWWKIVAGTNKKIKFTYIRLKGNNRSNGFYFLIIYVKSQNLRAMHYIPMSLILVWSTSIVNRFSLDLLQFWRRAGFQQLDSRWDKEFNCLRQKNTCEIWENTNNIVDYFRLVDAFALPQLHNLRIQYLKSQWMLSCSASWNFFFRWMEITCSQKFAKTFVEVFTYRMID